MDTAIWTVEVSVSPAKAAAAAEVLERFTDTVASFEDGEGRWSVTGYFVTRPDSAVIEVALAEAGASVRPDTRRLDGRDWLAENRKSFEPIRIGPHFVHASFFEGRIPPGAKPIELDAGQAFGTGSHETTRGCLAALSRLASRRRPTRPLDLGTGSGILAIAMVQLWHVSVLAADIDPVSVRVAAENARRNRVHPWVRTVHASSMRHRVLRQAAPFDLIVANILAGPLVRLAPQIGTALAPGGRVVLSGLLRRQEAEVLAAYRLQNLGLVERVTYGDWPTLILGR